MKNRILNVLLLCLLVAACGREPTEEHADEHTEESHAESATTTSIAPEIAKEAGIVVAPAGPGVIRDEHEVQGLLTTVEGRHARVVARFAGPVRSVSVSVGDTVRAGQSVAVVESNTSLSNYTVLAPIAGTVLSRDVSVGDLAGSQPLFEIADLSRLWVDLHLFGADAQHITPGLPVEVVRLSDGAVSRTKLDRILPGTATASQSTVARATLVNEDGRWRPGAAVRARVTVAEQPVALMVPSSALQRLRDWDVVFIREGDSYEARPVELGRRDGQNVEVTAGLSAGRPGGRRTELPGEGGHRKVRRFTRSLRTSPMLETIIRAAIAHRWLTLLLTLGLAVLGGWSFTRLPIDATPDITNVQVQINTEAPGYSPLEVEQRVTWPIETALSGLARLDYTRSLSRYGLSQVTVVFEDGTDIYFARQQVAERLQQARTQLPAGLQPELGPVTTGPGRDLHVHGGGGCRRVATRWHAVDAHRPAHAPGLGGASAVAQHARRHRGEHHWWIRAPDPHHARIRCASWPTASRCTTSWRPSRATTRIAAPATSSATGSNTWCAFPARSRTCLHCGPSCSIAAMAFRSGWATWPR